ncbi:MAG: hypothetical protein ACLQAT_12345 [Candidatus Binataceae bacterium]
MARQLSMATRRELKQAIGERYRAAGLWERRQIFDEFTRVTGYHRKHALQVLNRQFVPQLARRRRRIYGEAVHQALTLLWEAADRICGKRLKPLLIESTERHGHLRLDPVVRSAQLDISAVTTSIASAPNGSSAAASLDSGALATRSLLHPLKLLPKEDFSG